MSKKYKLFRGTAWYPVLTEYELEQHELELSSKDYYGHVKIGENIDVDENGVISIKEASTQEKGIVQIVDDLITDDSTKVLSAKQGYLIKQMIDNIDTSGGSGNTGESNLTQDDIDNWNNHIANSSIHITSAERTNWSNKASTDVVSNTKNGLMTSDDKIKLDSISNGANYTQVVDNLTSTSGTSALSAKQGRVLKDTLDTKAAKTNATIIASGLMSNTDKVKLDGISSNATYTPVVNSLASNSPTHALSAYQGKVLNEKIIALQNGHIPESGSGGSLVLVEDTLNSSSALNALSANQGRVLKELIDSKVDEGFVDAAIENLIETTPTAVYVLNEISGIMENNDALEGLMTLIGNKAEKTSVNYATDGLMSVDDKIKLDSVEEYANYTEVIDNLTSTMRTSALSAYQGKILNEKFDSIEDRVSDIETNGSGGTSNVVVEDSLVSTSTVNALSANKGKELNENYTTLANKVQTLEDKIDTIENTSSNLTWSAFEF